jgi:hypothetical protein
MTCTQCWRQLGKEERRHGCMLCSFCSGRAVVNAKLRRPKPEAGREVVQLELFGEGVR